MDPMYPSIMSASPNTNRPWRSGARFSSGWAMANCRHANSPSPTAPAAMQSTDGSTVRVTSFSPKMKAESPAKLSTTLRMSMGRSSRA